MFMSIAGIRVGAFSRDRLEFLSLMEAIRVDMHSGVVPRYPLVKNSSPLFSSPSLSQHSAILLPTTWPSLERDIAAYNLAFA